MNSARTAACASSSSLFDRRALLFDLDGTLVDSTRAHALAFAQVVAARLPEIARGFDYQLVRGLDTPSAWRRLGVQSTGSIDALTHEKRAAYLELVAAGAIDAFPDAHALCAALRGRGKLLIVVTNASRQAAVAALAATGLGPLVDDLVSVDDVAEPKPSPRPYVEAMRRFDLVPVECLAIEDGDEALAAARGAGIDVVLVHRSDAPGDVRSFATLQDLGRALVPGWPPHR